MWLFVGGEYPTLVNVRSGWWWHQIRGVPVVRQHQSRAAREEKGRRIGVPSGSAVAHGEESIFGSPRLISGLGAAWAGLLV